MQKTDQLLYKTHMIPGGRSIINRSYAVGRKNFYRLNKNDLLSIHVEFNAKEKLPDKVLVHFENFAHNKSRVYTQKLTDNGSEFVCRVFPKNYGVTRFKVKYRLNRKWYWDYKPFSYFVVDPPELRDMKIYTLIPNVSGTISDWKDELIRIKELGFNMVHILPVSHMGASESPYAAFDLMNVDPCFLNNNTEGSQKAIEELVEHALNIKMRLCFDLVFNNIGIDSLICKNRPDWLTEDPDEDDGIKRGGWSDGKTFYKWRDLAFLNYNIPCTSTREELWHYMREYALYWAGMAAKTHGMIRLDNLHSSDFNFVRWVLGEIRSQYPELIVFGELFDSEERIEEKVLDYGLNYLLATPWEHKFVPELRRYIEYVHKKHDKLRYLFPINSHDSLSPTQEFGSVDATLPRLVISTLMGAGPSGITQGVEFGISEKLKFIGRQGKVKIEGQKDFTLLIKQLNQLIDTHKEFQVPGNLLFIDSAHNAILGCLRYDQNNQVQSLVFVNLDTQGHQELIVSLYDKKVSGLDYVLGDGYWHVVDDVLKINLKPNGYLVLEAKEDL